MNALYSSDNLFILRRYHFEMRCAIYDLQSRFQRTEPKNQKLYYCMRHALCPAANEFMAMTAI